jgi:hypothetical protein
MYAEMTGTVLNTCPASPAQPRAAREKRTFDQSTACVVATAALRLLRRRLVAAISKMDEIAGASDTPAPLKLAVGRGAETFIISLNRSIMTVAHPIPRVAN